MAREVLMGDIGVTSPDPKIAVPRADMSGPNAVEALGGIAGEVVQGVQSGRALKGVQQDVERFAVVGEAAERGITVDPNTGEVLEGDASLEMRSTLKRVQQNSAQKFKEIALEVEQRGLYSGSMMARLHTERTIRDLSMQTPGFEDEIRRTAASVLGYDPMGFGMRQILDVDKPTKGSKQKSKLDLWREEVEVFVHNYNQVNSNNPITLAQGDRYLSNREVNNRSAEVYNSRVAQGNAAFEETLQSVNFRPGPLEMFFQAAQAKTASGEGWNWQDTALLKNEMAQIKMRYRQELIDEATRSNPQALRNQVAMDRLDYTVNTLFKPYEEVISRSTITAFLESKGAQMELQGQDFFRRVAPGLTLLADGLKNNQAVAGQMMEIFYSTASDPQSALWIQQHPELRAIFGDSQEPMAWLKRSAERLGYGGTAGPAGGGTLSREDEQKQQVVDAQLFKELWRKGTPEQRAEHVKIVSKSNPKLVIGVVSADPQSFNLLDDESKLEVATQQAVELQSIIRDAARTIVESGRDVRVSETTGGLVEVSSRNQGGRRTESFSTTSEAVKRYNAVHLNLYKNPAWRQYLTTGKGESEVQVSAVVGASINSLVYSSRLEELEERREWLSDKVSSPSAGRSGVANLQNYKQELSQVESSIEELSKKRDRANAEMIRGKALLQRGMDK